MRRSRGRDERRSPQSISVATTENGADMAVKTSTAAVIGGVVLLVAAGIYVWPIAWHAPPAPAVPRYAAGRGVAYCRKLGEVARKRSSHDTFVAWIAAIFGSF